MLDRASAPGRARYSQIPLMHSHARAQAIATSNANHLRSAPALALYALWMMLCVFAFLGAAAFLVIFSLCWMLLGE